jgi:hypothetical protein
MARRKAGVIVNMITVHDYGVSPGDNQSDSDPGSIPEQIIVEEETTNNELLSINDNKLDIEHCQCKIIIN